MQFLVCRDQKVKTSESQTNKNQTNIHQTVKHFVFLSNGNCDFEIWDGGEGIRIAALAFGIWDEKTMALTRQIRKSHEIECMIFPGGPEEEKIRKELMEMGIPRVLTGDGKLLLGPWELCFWSRNGSLSIFHDRISGKTPEEYLMGELNILDETMCTVLGGRDQEYCETNCLQFADSDALNGRKIADGGLCTGTLILGEQYPESWKAYRDRIRTVFLTVERKAYPMFSRELHVGEDRLYRYIFGGNLSDSQVGHLILSSPYIRYQSLKNHHGACINGCFLSGLQKRDSLADLSPENECVEKD